MAIFYADLSYELLEETPSYPEQEMINELAGIFGIYFGFSIMSLVPLCLYAFRSFRQIFSRNRSINFTNETEYHLIMSALFFQDRIIF